MSSSHFTTAKNPALACSHESRSAPISVRRISKTKQAANYPLHLTKGGPRVQQIGELADMMPDELVRFVDRKRAHFQQGLLILDKGRRDSFLERELKLADEVLKALVGGVLDDEEALKIEGTLLAEVLEEELGRDGADEDAGLPGLLESGADDLGPFRTDLDYLQCHFDLLATRIRIRILQVGADDLPFSDEDPRCKAARTVVPRADTVAQDRAPHEEHPEGGRLAAPP